MTHPILATKLHIPTARPQLVARPHLVARLNAGLHRKLTLLSAPAGFGKTTVLSEWIPTSPRCVTWLSLDEDDNDPVRFWTHFIAALQGLRPDLGAAAHKLLQSPQPPAITNVLTTLINELNTFPDSFAAVLDDYHVIESRPIDEGLAFLIDHLPPQMHLLVTSRDDPNLPLARLRARDQMNELRVDDLRFSEFEAADFLNEVAGLGLTAGEVAALEARTEGWVAGLHLAALSLRGHPDASGFITSFTGSHRFVMDYLIEEVLQRQAQHVQEFLLRTAVLERLCGPLCDAVTGSPPGTGQGTLESLEQANLFIVPLDDQRYWYRYHHLFADLLRQRLRQSGTLSNGQAVEAAAVYHQRASQWYEAQGYELEAFQHAAAAGDIERAERLIAGRGMPLQYRGAFAPILGWLQSLPPETLAERPALTVTYASALTMVGQQIAQIETLLETAEAALPPRPADENSRDLLGQIAAIRAMLAIPQQQVEVITAEARLALQDLHPDNLPARTSAAWALGYAYQLQGQRAAASQTYQEAFATSQASGNTMISFGAATCLGQIQESQTQLQQAAEWYRRVLELAGDPPLPLACEALVRLGKVHYQWNDLQAAEEFGQHGLELARQVENVDTPAAAMVLLARVQLARGELETANDLLTQAGQFLEQHHSNQRLPEVAAVQVQLLLRQGDLERAAALAGQYDIPMSQARAALAAGDPPAALALVEAVLREAEAHDWQAELLEARLLQALALHANGAEDLAYAALEQALALARPGGYVRLFLDEGPPMAALLKGSVQKGSAVEPAQQLLAAFGDTPVTAPLQQPLVEPLTERELEVLGRLRSYQTGPEIADALAVSLNTLRTHTKNIYAKLGVNSRQEAVRRAEELGLL